MRGIQALGFAAGIVATMLASAAWAQATDNYPNRPLRIIVPYPAGGIVDIVARAVTEQVGRDWKTPVIVEARPGGNSNIGTATVARSDPDGYKGQPQALIDLMTNLMHFEIVSLELALPHIKAGTIKPLAVLTDKRVADLPDIPTIAEAGFAEAAYVP